MKITEDALTEIHLEMKEQNNQTLLMNIETTKLKDENTTLSQSLEIMKEVSLFVLNSFLPNYSQ